MKTLSFSVPAQGSPSHQIQRREPSFFLLPISRAPLSGFRPSFTPSPSIEWTFVFFSLCRISFGKDGGLRCCGTACARRAEGRTHSADDSGRSSPLFFLRSSPFFLFSLDADALPTEVLTLEAQMAGTHRKDPIQQRTRRRVSSPGLGSAQHLRPPAPPRPPPAPSRKQLTSKGTSFPSCRRLRRGWSLQLGCEQEVVEGRMGEGGEQRHVERCRRQGSEPTRLLFARYTRQKG